MVYKIPTTLEEAAQVLAEFAQTAPGRLPERVQVAIKLSERESELNILKRRILNIIEVNGTQFVDGDLIRSQLKSVLNSGQ